MFPREEGSIPMWFLGLSTVILSWTFLNGMWLGINLTFNNKLESRDNTFDLQSFYPFIKIQRRKATYIYIYTYFFPHNICRTRVSSSHTLIPLTLVHPSISSFFSGHPQAVAAEASKDYGRSVGNFADLLRWSAENVDLSSHTQRPVRAPMHFP